MNPSSAVSWSTSSAARSTTAKERAASTSVSQFDDDDDDEMDELEAEEEGGTNLNKEADLFEEEETKVALFLLFRCGFEVSG